MKRWSFAGFICLLCLIAAVSIYVGCFARPLKTWTGQFTQEGCQYLEVKTLGGHYSFSHKGNCSNPIHR